MLYEGQGKDNIIVNNNSFSNTTKSMVEGHINTQGMEGLHPPRMEESGDIVCRETKTLLQKENKCRKRKLKEQQEATTQWNTYEGKGDTSTLPPTTPTATYRNSMCPAGQALTHPAAEVLKEWATFGCPTRTRNMGGCETRNTPVSTHARSHYTLCHRPCYLVGYFSNYC